MLGAQAVVRRGLIHASVFVLGVASLVMAPHAARGAAAAVSVPARQRAKTELSLGNVSTDPALRQIQLTFDPAASDPVGTPLAIQSFQLDVSYNAADLDIVSITGIDGFTLTSLGNSSTPGLIDNISGEFNGEGPNYNFGDQNFFNIVFQLKPGVDPATPLSFEFFANDPTDNVVSQDADGNVFTSNGPSTDISPVPGEIIPAFITASVANGVISTTTPLPSAVWTGAAMLAMLLAGTRLRQRRHQEI